jgi:putative thiamine transport system ATP-binding protein
MLKIAHVTIKLGLQTLIDELSFNVAKGEVVSLMGASGCGKSTLLHYICGTVSKSFNVTGQLYLDGKSFEHTPFEHRNIGILHQSPLLFPHMTTIENLLFAIPNNGSSKKQRLEQAWYELDAIGLADQGSQLPLTLSGGQQARVALIRCLLSEPSMLLLDEPFSKLDLDRRHSLRTFVLEHVKKHQLPTLLVTHDAEDASTMSQDIIQL